MPDIRTIQDWRRRIGPCGCCPVPATPAPRTECQTLTGTSSVDGHAQFTNPEGDPDDDLPAIYKAMYPRITRRRFTGTGWAYASGPGTDLWISAEVLVTKTYNWSEIAGEEQSITVSETRNSHNSLTDSCSSSGGAYIGPFTDPFGVTYTSEGPQEFCRPTERGTEEEGTSEQGSALSLKGCPGPFTEDSELAWNYRRKTLDFERLAEPITKSELRAEAMEELPDDWPSEPSGSGCVARYATTWPTLGDIGEWPSCDDGPPDAEATATVEKLRYRRGIPAGFSRTTYELQWDEGFFPKAWIGWDENSRDGPEPEPRPNLLASREWSYEGGDTFSAWFTVAPPEVEGEIRICNTLARGSQTRYGRKPTEFGDSFDFEA